MVEPVTVVVPVWKEILSQYEKISLDQNLSILKNHPFTIVTHNGLNLEEIVEIFDFHEVSFEIIYFSERYFLSTKSYNKLMLSINFYRRFKRYKYICICQLDCFIFSDNLKLWVEQNHSYIGAPWLKGYNEADTTSPIIGVGNGGLSLRKVDHHLKVLLSLRYIIKPKSLFSKALQKNWPINKKVKFLIESLTYNNNTFFLFNSWSENEDAFWGEAAERLFNWFMVPDYKVAMKFSMEVHPRRLFILNDKNLPFGCHAWWTYDLEFWKPYIKKYGHAI